MKIESVTSLVALACLLAWSCLRFVGLDASPPGFYNDESAQATHFICLAQQGTDANGVVHPFFSSHYEAESQGALGLLPPTLLYPGALWVKIFGPSIAAIRAMPAFFMTIAIAGLFALGRLLAGETAGLLALLAGAMSPWLFPFSRMAGPQPIELCGLVWGCFYALRSTRRRDELIATALLVLAMFSYPPGRVQLALLFLPLLWFRAREHGLSVKSSAPFAAAVVIGALPVAIQSFTSANLARVNYVSIFSDSDLLESIEHLLTNIWAHFMPGFLFLHGDWNMRHSSRHSGELGWIDIAAAAFAAFSIVARVVASQPLFAANREGVRRRRVLLFLGAGFMSGILPASFTTGVIPFVIPHALRAIGAAPFIALASGLILSRLLERRPKFGPAIAVLSLAFSCHYLATYFWAYPAESLKTDDDWWTPGQRYSAERAVTTGDWTEFALTHQRLPRVSNRYFLIAYGGETCASSDTRLDELYRRVRGGTRPQTTGKPSSSHP